MKKLSPLKSAIVAYDVFSEEARYVVNNSFIPTRISLKGLN